MQSQKLLRHIGKPKQTTIRLEQPFGAAIDHLAEADSIHWRELVSQMWAKPKVRARGQLEPSYGG